MFPGAPVAERWAEESARSGIWPDTSMKLTLEAFPNAGFILDSAGIVRFSNARARHLFPATRPGDPFTLTFRSPDIGAALADARQGRPRSAEYHEPGETTNAYSVTLHPLQPPGEAGGFTLVTFDDVSDRLAIARMRTDFVANASHELRTPLASLTGFIETLLGPARNDPQASEKFLKIMLDQARRMRRLLDDLLSLSRVEMRVHRRPTELIDLVSVLRNVADAMAPLAAESSVVLTVKAVGPLEVVGERDELVQVFQNLVENAIRYGASGGRVEVSVEPRPCGRCRHRRPRAGLRAGHSGRAPAPPDRAFLPRGRGRQPRDEGHRSRPRHREAHLNAPSGAAGGEEPSGRRGAFHRHSAFSAGSPSSSRYKLSTGNSLRCHQDVTHKS